MNYKKTITLSDRYMRYAERMVENGQFPSIEKVIEAGLERLMRADERTPEQQDSVSAMADEIRRRINAPQDQWVSMDEDNIFDRVRARLAEKRRAK